MTAEEQRLQADRDRTAYWKRWGPYLSERQWGTVREDYSADGSAWDFFPYDQARSRAYRWGEDGIAGISDNHQRLCFAIALWNEADAMLKERIFGLSGDQGNHGEDVKDYYFYLDNTPTHAYMKYLYKYPHEAFPYAQLIAENQQRDRDSPEFELLDTGIFADDRYFDVLVEYAKASPEDLLIRISVVNRGAEAKPLHLLPTLWFRNTWSWTNDAEKPVLKVLKSNASVTVIEAAHPTLGTRWLYCQAASELLFTENETNTDRLFGTPNQSAYVKDGINDYLVHDRPSAVNPNQQGTKVAGHYVWTIAAGSTQTAWLRLSDTPDLIDPFGADFATTFQLRQQEADEFYRRICPFPIPEEARMLQRQAFAGMLWNKQFYYYVVEDWLTGDPAGPSPPASRWSGRNSDWLHLFCDDILSMPDKWEYPWFAAWDLAFHVVPLAMIDPDFAKQQLTRLTREWYMHPNGQLPAYEWEFQDVNPPVHAWATWHVYCIEQKLYGRGDRLFLERVFQKLLLNFTWWVNRKDAAGKNIFQGGFLGMDNIGVFNRSADLPAGGCLQQADATSWMAMYCMNMLTIALELAIEEPIYEDIASKFFEHFLRIADAMNHPSPDGLTLWDEADGFYYDVLRSPTGENEPIRVRSLVGLVPLLAVGTLEREVLEKLPNFKRRAEWFIQNRPALTAGIACMQPLGVGDRRLLSAMNETKLRRTLQRLLDEAEFLSPYGIRSMSKFHQAQPYQFAIDGTDYCVDYEPAESRTDLFGGNSNWRGPIWLPMNYLIIEALKQFHHYFGETFQVECPTGSGQLMTLQAVAIELAERLGRIFLLDATGRRPVFGQSEPFQTNPDWQNLILFYEYFQGDTGAGLGANHQTGWTGLIAEMIQQCGEAAHRQHPSD